MHLHHRRKLLNGVNGQPFDYYIFSALTTDITLNFGSWIEKGPYFNDLPDTPDTGKPLKAMMSASEITNAKQDNLKTKILPANRFPADQDIDVVPIFSPVYIPLFKGQPVSRDKHSPVTSLAHNSRSSATSPSKALKTPSISSPSYHYHFQSPPPMTITKKSTWTTQQTTSSVSAKNKLYQ